MTTIESPVYDAATARPGAGPAAAQTAWRALRRVVGAVVHVLWPVAAVYLLWAAWVEGADLPPAVAPHPDDVLRYIADNPGSYFADAAATIWIVVCGLTLGAVAGVVLASASWFSPLLRSAISGPALITQCLPVVTMVPVIARVFGYNQRTVVLIAALIAFFPVLVFVSAGMAATPPGSADVFRVFGARRWQRFRYLAVPSAIPRLLVAMRISVVAAVVGAMLAQWIMGTSGLGYRLAVAQASFRSSEAWGASVVAIAVGVLLFGIASSLSRLAQRRFD
ncbi:MAG: ABC transporter permease subunit [Actinomycetota bacterium]|nr:ABC transporter permease subunit [Actinomycetota bacterium]